MRAAIATPDSLWRNRTVLAPMVRAGTLPLRLLALQYGADTVYGEEIVDKRILACRRVENAHLGTVDFVSPGPQGMDQLIFRTDRRRERGRCVFQMGTAGPELAVQAARLVAGDVDAIDVNMGCPKHFSISGGMGVALTQDPQRACSIIRALRDALDIPVSCKIRLKDTASDTVDFVKALEAAGAQAIGVHARTASDRPHDAPHWDQLKALVDAVSVPVIVNGDIWGPAEADEVRKLSGCSSVMCARGALKNTRLCFSRPAEATVAAEGTDAAGRAEDAAAAGASAASSEDVTVVSAKGTAAAAAAAPAAAMNKPPESIMGVIQDYVKLAINYDNNGGNTKYVVQYMLKMNGILGSTFGQSISSGKTRTLRDLAVLCDLLDYFDQHYRPPPQSAAAAAASSAHMYRDDFFFSRPKKRARMAQDGRQVPPDFKKMLETWGRAQEGLARKHQVPQYKQLAVAAKAERKLGTNDPAYRAAVMVAGQQFDGGWARSKKAATSKAALEALRSLNPVAVEAWAGVGRRNAPAESASASSSSSTGNSSGAVRKAHTVRNKE